MKGDLHVTSTYLLNWMREFKKECDKALQRPEPEPEILLPFETLWGWKNHASTH